MKPKTQKAAIIRALLEGRVLSTMAAFKDFFCTNLAREIGRGVERPYGVVVSKDRVDFVSTYGQHGFYYRYRLNYTPQNMEGIQKMINYVIENDPSAIIPAGVKVEPKIGKNITDKNKMRNVVSDVYRKIVSKTF